MASKTKQKEEHPMLPIWLARIGKEVLGKRGEEKQLSFANRVQVSRATLSAIENGKHSYGLEVLLRVLAGLDADPVKSLVAISKNLNALDAMAIDGCRTFILLDEDGQRAVLSVMNRMLEAGRRPHKAG